MRLRAPAFGLVALAIAHDAFAQTKEECVAAYTDAQVLRSKQKLREAKKLLAICADDACPQALKKDCVPWLGEVEKALPSLIVDTEASAHVTIDGEPAIPGQVARVDPGDHVVTAEAAGFKSETQHVKVDLGETHTTRIILTASQVTSTTPADASLKTIVPLAPIVVTAVGLIGLGLFAGFGVAGNGIKSDLDAENCKPNCSADRVNAIKGDYVAADVSLGIGIAAVAVGVILFIVSPWHETKSSASLGSLVLHF